MTFLSIKARRPWELFIGYLVNKFILLSKDIAIHGLKGQELNIEHEEVEKICSKLEAKILG